MWWKGRGDLPGRCKRDIARELNLKEEIGLASRQSQTEKANPSQKDRQGK